MYIKKLCGRKDTKKNFSTSYEDIDNIKMCEWSNSIFLGITFK